MEEADGGGLALLHPTEPVSPGAQVLLGGPSQGSCPHPGDSFPSCAPFAWGGHSFYSHRCLDASAALVVSLNLANTSEMFFSLTNLFHRPP